MNKEIKEKWVAALRSGEYEQAVGSLRDNHGYCCLGVLCDLYAKEKGIDWEMKTDWKDYVLYGSAAMLPAEVQKWAGLNDGDPMVKDNTLSFWNDSLHAGFTDIADLIERNL